MEQVQDSTVKLIESTLDKIRPFMQREGGDVKFVKFEDGYVFLKAHGACDGCAYVGYDISQGIEVILMEEVPGVIGVKLID